ncbi:VWA domain-containing protein [Acetobacter sp.]|uniref:VWA domain-containing protein n=1 Tax=Acetobacter sp. TaxID=440 RepID=UPI0039E801DE
MIDSFTHSIAFAPLLPRWVLIALAVVLVAALAIGLLARMRGTLLRALAGSVILLWLSGPQSLTETHRDLPETALVVVDQTPSMQLRDRASIARAAALALGESAPEGLTLRTVTVRGERTGGTRLFDALSQAAADIPPDQLAGAVFITDGQTRDAPADVPERLALHDEAGKSVTLPLHVLLTGRGEEKDRRLRVLQAPPYTIVGKSAVIRVQVDDLGPGTQAGATATVSLTTDGNPTLEVPVRTGEPQDISLPITHPGETLGGLSVSPLADEVSAENNRDVLSITGVRDRLRVLLVSGAPNQGERVWRRLLKADPSVDLVHFTILRPPEKDDGTPLSDLALIAFPVDELFRNKIDQFDLIILDGFENRHILPPSYLHNIAQFVRKGGGLFLIAGPEFSGPYSLQDTSVGDILPAHVPSSPPDLAPTEAGPGIIVRRFRPQLTEDGRRHPVTAELPGAPALHPAPDSLSAAHDVPGEWGPWYRALRSDDAHGQVLMHGPDDSPLLVLDHVDNGRVALLLSDQIWLWSRGEFGGGPQAELLRRISHWLMKEPDLEEERLEAHIADGMLTVTRHTVSGAPPTSVTVTAPDGTKSPLSLHPSGSGLLSGRMAATHPGIWSVDDGDHRAFAAPVRPDPEEFSDLRLTADIVGPVAKKTGGQVIWLGNDIAHPAVPAITLGATSGNALNFPQRHAHVLTGTSTTPLLPAWLVLLLAAGLLAAGWYREGRG